MAEDPRPRPRSPPPPRPSSPHTSTSHNGPGRSSLAPQAAHEPLHEDSLSSESSSTTSEDSASPQSGENDDGESDRLNLSQIHRRANQQASHPHVDSLAALESGSKDPNNIGSVEEGNQNSTTDEDGFRMRHGWDSQYAAEQLRILATNFHMYYNDKRHERNGIPSTELKATPGDWRMRDRLKTVAAALAVCLNIGVDPPDDFPKPSVSARLECWVDPTAATAPSSHNAINQIGKTLQVQYEQLSVRTRYKILPDPTVDEMKKYCATLRRNAKDERILFHYNGHGVPKPTPSGEIWVFNKDYTQYIPIPLNDLQSWLSAPSLFVYDCSAANLIIQNFLKFVDKYEMEHADLRIRDPDTPYRKYGDCIHLAACRDDENLPTNPLLPADLFTACLTTPIEIGVRFFLMRNPLHSNLRVEDASKIPGKSAERRTPIGELNWIFTAITDTIAWNSLPKKLFKRLFRQDLLVASLFRNFLLAQRIMRIYGCQPQSYPRIPDTHDHPLWKSWDLAVEMALAQLPSLKLAEEKQLDYQYQHSEFFYEQLTAFEVYLDHGAKEQQLPEQLPIVLQVLLSQVHRLRALVLLSRFLDLGPWAVELALSIGIFPYVLKLLQSQAIELKPPLVFIWARILAVDQSVQSDLLKDNGYQYFVGILHPGTGLPVRDVSEHRAMCAFIIAMFCRDFKQGQAVAHTQELVDSCLSHVSLADTEHPLLRQWSCLCLSVVWSNFPEAKWSGIRSDAHTKLCQLALDPVAEVRTAMVHALTTLIGIPELTDHVAEIEELIVIKLLPMTDDGSSLVRKELTVFLSHFVRRYQETFVDVVFDPMLQTVRFYTTSAFPRLAYALGFESPRRTPPVGDGYRNGSVSDSHAINTDLPWTEWPEPTAWTATSWESWKASGVENSRATSGTNSSDDIPGRASSQSYFKLLKDGPPFIFSTVWKHVLFLSADPDSEVADNASAIVDFVFEQIIRMKGSRGQLILELIADLRDTRYSPPSDPPEEFSVDGTPSPTPSVFRGMDGYNGHMPRSASRAPSLRNIALGHNSRSMPDFNRDQAPRPSSAIPLRGGSETPIDGTGAQSPPLPKHGRHPRSSYLPPLSLNQTPIPLPSTFFDWSTEYFREPQMRQTESDEPGSADYNARLWRRNRNEKILDTTQTMKEQAGSSRWDHQFGYFDTGKQPTTMCFHQYDDHLVVTDKRNSVRVWDWQTQRLLNKFSNGNPPGSLIKGARFINEDDQAMLMTGSSDGVIKVFGKYDTQGKTQAVCAFRAITTRNPYTAHGDIVFDWVQGRGHILVGGDSKEIAIWSARSETCFLDIPTGSSPPVTSITSDQLEGHVFAAGFADGVVRVYDQRANPVYSPVRVWNEHKHPIKNIHMQRGGLRELVSGSSDGTVKFWDIRQEKSCITVAATRDRLRSLSVHEHAPVFAIGSERHNVKVFNTKGQFLSSFEPLNTFLHQSRSAPIATTAFHPHRMILACASLHDSHITLFSCMDRRRNMIPGI